MNDIDPAGWSIYAGFQFIMLNELDRPIQDQHRANMRGIDPANLQALIAILEDIRIVA